MSSVTIYTIIIDYLHYHIIKVHKLWTAFDRILWIKTPLWINCDCINSLMANMVLLTVVWTWLQYPDWEEPGKSYLANMKSYSGTCRIFSTPQEIWQSTGMSLTIRTSSHQSSPCSLSSRRTSLSYMKVDGRKLMFLYHNMGRLSFMKLTGSSSDLFFIFQSKSHLINSAFSDCRMKLSVNSYI